MAEEWKCKCFGLASLCWKRKYSCSKRRMFRGGGCGNRPVLDWREVFLQRRRSDMQKDNLMPLFFIYQPYISNLLDEIYFFNNGKKVWFVGQPRCGEGGGILCWQNQVVWSKFTGKEILHGRGSGPCEGGAWPMWTPPTSQFALVYTTTKYMRYNIIGKYQPVV